MRCKSIIPNLLKSVFINGFFAVILTTICVGTHTPSGESRDKYKGMEWQPTEVQEEQENGFSLLCEENKDKGEDMEWQPAEAQEEQKNGFTRLSSEELALILSLLPLDCKMGARGVSKEMKSFIESNVTWSRDIIRFCKENYGLNPWEIRKQLIHIVTPEEIPLLVPYNEIITAIKVEGIAESMSSEEALQSLKYFPYLKSLDLRRSGIENLDFLRGFTSLRSLNLSRCTKVESLNSLSEHYKLKVLYLTECSNLKDISALLGLRNLTILDLTGCRCVDKEHISYLHEILPNLKIYY